MSDLDAANWDQGQGLSWSGKWHIISETYPGKSFARASCGASVYTQGHVPRYVGRLQGIAKGYQSAPVCKKCQRKTSAA